MLIDSLLVFDSSTPLTVSAPSNNVLDFGANRDLGVGDNDLKISILFPVPLVGPGGATVQADFETSADNVTYAPLITGPAVLLAEANAHGILRAEIPQGILRYVRVTYTVAGGPLTAGTVFAAIVPGVDAPRYGKRNFATL